MEKHRGGRELECFAENCKNAGHDELKLENVLYDVILSRGNVITMVQFQVLYCWVGAGASWVGTQW